MTEPAPPFLGNTNVEARDNLERFANRAFQMGRTDEALQHAQVAGLYAIVCVLERIEDTLDRIDNALAEANDPGAP